MGLNNLYYVLDIMEGQKEEINEVLFNQIVKCGLSLASLPSELLREISATYDRYESRLAVQHLTIQQANAGEGDLFVQIQHSPGNNSQHDLVNANERFRFALKAIGDAIWDWDLVNDKLYWSEGYEKLFGYKSGSNEVLNTWKSHVHPDDEQRVVKGLTEVIRNKSQSLWSDEYRYIKSDGTIAYVLDRGYIIYNEEGIPVRMVGAMQDITSRREAEEKIRLSEVRMTEAQHVACFGTWEFSLEDTTHPGEIDLLWSFEVYRIFEQSRSFKVTINSFMSLVHPDDREAVWKTVKQTIANGSRYVMDHRIILPDESVKWVHEEAGIMYDEARKPIKLLGIVQDITDRKIAEEKLKSAHREYEILFNTIDEVFFSFDTINRCLLQMSSACINIYGYTPEEFLRSATLCFDVVHPEDVEIFNRFNAELAKGKQCVQQYRIVHRDGSVRWLEAKILPGIEDGKLVRLDGIARDITQSKQMQLELVESEKHNRNLFDQSSIGMVLANMDGTISDVNAAYADIIGYTLEEAKKLSYWDLTPEEYYKTEELKLAEMQVTGRYTTYEKEYIHKNGNRVPVKMSGVVIQKENVNYILSSVEDITESKRQKNDIIAKNAELSKTNAELDKFVYSVSHDLRAPLCSILGIIELSEDETGDELILRNLKMIKSGIQRMDSFIHDILNYNRNARIEIKSESINLKALIYKAAEVARAIDVVKKGDPEVNINFSETSSFFSDEGRIMMILQNVISNAIRYNDPGRKPVIYINAQVTTEKAVMEVIDNGIGIPEKHIGRIFDMFFRVSEKSTGSGLGLYIVKEAVERLKGDIKVISKYGTGTTFTITIPNTISR